MPLFRQPPKAPTPGEQALAAEQADKEAALQSDKNPDEPGVEPDNLTLVLLQQRYPAAKYSHPLLRLTEERLTHMSRLEILSVGHDRAYWRRGVASLDKTGLIAKFLEAQATDQSLHDDPTQVAV